MKAKILALTLGGLLALVAQRPAWGEDVCGDFNITGTELCDDGNAFDGDGCSADCATIEEGWFCLEFEFDIFKFSFCQTICGDGLVLGFEICDDGNLTDGDGCDDGTGFCVPTACGNFVISPASGEACDDGNPSDGDGCSAVCELETGWECDNAFGFSICTAICGDHLFVGQEVCEDGNGINGDGCDDDVSNELSPGNCTFTACGNLVVTEGEECDDGNTDDADSISDFCDSNCTFPKCGNGVLDQIETEFVTYIEECDDGNPFIGDGCDNNCTVTACGNGVITGDEICDDGNTSDDDGCSSDCLTKECGDGVKGVNEICDDGNVLSGDGCSSVCTLENVSDVCANGILDAGEECDDGNMVDGDGCQADCTDRDFESANPTLDFTGLIAGDTVILNAPDPRDFSPALSLRSALVLPPTCSCTWAIVPSALGHFSSAIECQTLLNLDREGDGTLFVETDCGAEGEATSLQKIVVQPQPAPESGGCGLIP